MTGNIRPFILCAFMAISGMTSCAIEKGFRSLGTAEFETAIKDTAVVTVDVRTAAEYSEGHIPGTAFNMDVLDEDFPSEAVRLLPAGKTIAVYCRSGKRSKKAAEILVREGFRVIELDNGFNGWVEAGRPVE